MKSKREAYSKSKMVILERVSDFSLEYRAIRLSEVFGSRRKDVLHGASYAWTPVLRVFDKL